MPHGKVPKDPTYDRLDSWKEIAAHLRRGVRSVQRWERTSRMPVHRHGHSRSSTVYAFRSELDAWWIGRGHPEQPEAQGPLAEAGAVRTPTSVVVDPAEVNDRQRIVVMPFADLSPDQDQTYFCQGLVEELVTTLAAVPTLQVSGPTRVPPTDGHVAEPNTVLEGSVRKSGLDVRVSARLIRADDRTVLASFHCDGSLDQTLALHEDVAARVVAALGVGGQQPPRISRRHSADLTAYDLYLMARHYWNERTIDGLERSIALATKAVERDPSYGVAHAMLAMAHAVLGTYGSGPPRSSMERSRRAALRALAIDDTLSDAHTALGSIHFTYDWDCEKAEREFQRAIELNPNDATAYHWHGLVQTVRGRDAEAIECIQRAQRLEPTSLIIESQLAWVLYMFGRYEEALDKLAGTLERDRGFWRAYMNLGLCHLQLQQYDRAIDALETAVALNNYPTFKALLALAFVMAGRKTEGQAFLSDLEEGGRYVSSHYLAIVYLALGRKDRAIELLQRACADREWHMVWLNHEPLLDGLREHPEFQRLVRQVNL